MSSPAAAVRPYLGLRYFEERDAHLFFGRDDHVAGLLKELEEHRFVAVLGSSGTGKSSLVRAGLLPELRSGMIPKAGPRWKVAEFKPGRAPLEELSEAIGSELGMADARRLIDEGPLGIAQSVAAANLEPRTNVLVIADQFEEVFRFQREQSTAGGEGLRDASEECKALVRRLLDATSQPDLRIYVLLVMRSDYLGECNQFQELPERMSRSLYIVPRLRRDQLQEAITAPVGGQIEPAVVQRLLAEAGSDPDQLPRLQHLLGRMWDRAGGGSITMDHYREVGGWDEALERDLEEVYAGCKGAGQQACRRMFQQLSELDAGRAVRRRADLKELTELCGPAVRDVVAAFRAAAFLTAREDPVDITHESILREWSRLRGWLVQEDFNARRLRELADAAKDAGWREGMSTEEEQAVRGLEGLTLHNLAEWRKASDVTAVWARRYRTAVPFDVADAYLPWSQKRDDAAKRRVRRLSRLLWISGVALVAVMAVASWQFYRMAQKSDELARKAQDESKRADTAAAFALVAKTQADAAVADAQAARAEARGNAADAERLRKEAMQYRSQAQTMQTAAESNANSFAGASPTNFRPGRYGGARPEAIVIHLIDGTLAGAAAVFGSKSENPRSAHYGIGKDGTVLKFVPDADTAFHAGTVHEPTWKGIQRDVKGGFVNPNYYTIGIEHEGRSDEPWTDQMYTASSKLIAEIARRWGFPIDREHVVPHYAIDSRRSCPGRSVDLDRLVQMARSWGSSKAAY